MFLGVLLGVVGCFLFFDALLGISVFFLGVLFRCFLGLSLGVFLGVFV